jgi:hypothetical protein
MEVLERDEQLLFEAEQAAALGELAIALSAEQKHDDNLWWDELAVDIVETEYGEHMGFMDDIDEYLSMHEREQSFAAKIYTTVTEMAKGHDGPLFLMFDVDHTISDQGIDGKRVTRPAFPFVIALLREQYPERLHVGLLSTLKQAAVRDVCLADINPDVVDEDLIIGTWQYAELHPELSIYNSGIDGKQQCENLRDIIDPDVLAAVYADKLSPDDVRDADGKLEIITKIAKDNPNAMIAFIDNLTPSGMIRSDHLQIKGVHVGPEMQDSIYARNRQRLLIRKAEAGLATTKLMLRQSADSIRDRIRSGLNRS